VRQLQKLAYNVGKLLTKLKEPWLKACQQFDLPEQLIPRNMATRWNSTCNMATFAVPYSKPINLITTDKELKLQAFKLSNREWECAGELCQVLQVRLASPTLYLLNNMPVASQRLKDAKMYFLKKYPNVLWVIPSMDDLNKFFTECQLNCRDLSAPVRAALGMAKRTINRYYLKTNESDIY
jgi:hypothetical protein